MSAGNSLLGVLISLCGCFFSSFGIVLQKFAYLKRDKKYQEKLLEHEKKLIENPEEESLVVVVEENVTKSWIWVVGLICMIGSSIFDFFSYGLAASSLLAPMGSMTLVFNMFLAWKFLHESISKIDVVATFVIILGAVLAVVFGDRSESDYDLQGLISLYDNTLTIAYICVLGFVIFSFSFFAKLISVLMEHTTEPSKWVRRIIVLHPILLSVCSGCCGGFTTLFTKSASSIVSGLFEGEVDAFLRYESYLFILSMACSLILQVKHLNLGLAKYDALFIVPIYQTFWIITTILSGSIYFREITNFDTTQLIMFPIAILITLVGVWILAANQNNKKARVQIQPEEQVDKPIVTQSDSNPSKISLTIKPPPSEDELIRTCNSTQMNKTNTQSTVTISSVHSASTTSNALKKPTIDTSIHQVAQTSNEGPPKSYHVNKVLPLPDVPPTETSSDIHLQSQQFDQSLPITSSQAPELIHTKQTTSAAAILKPFPPDEIRTPHGKHILPPLRKKPMREEESLKTLPPLRLPHELITSPLDTGSQIPEVQE